jgi:hypothetical protein
MQARRQAVEKECLKKIDHNAEISPGEKVNDLFLSQGETEGDLFTGITFCLYCAFMPVGFSLYRDQ